MRIFCSSAPLDAAVQARIEACYAAIQRKIAVVRGVTGCHKAEDWLAFAGSPEAPALVLTLSTVKSAGSLYLYAEVDDEVSWQEWDFEKPEDFEDAIVAYIAPLVNRTVKTVTEKKKHAFLKISRYYFSENNTWRLIDEKVTGNRLLRWFLTKDSTEEAITSYSLITQGSPNG